MLTQLIFVTGNTSGAILSNTKCPRYYLIFVLTVYCEEITVTNAFAGNKYFQKVQTTTVSWLLEGQVR